jgi:hypothetical protein
MAFWKVLIDDVNDDVPKIQYVQEIGYLVFG